MQLKANLHMHTSDDQEDLVSYSTYEAIDAAADYGFQVLALTCHNTCAWRVEYAEYAQSKGILLLSGIEKNIGETASDRGRHVVLLGVDAGAEHVHTFADLETYRDAHPEMVVIAPHPFMDRYLSLNHYAEQYIDLFDMIEHSWFYSVRLNRNRAALKLAEKYRKPVVATSDTHFLNYLNDHYTYIASEEQTEAAVLRALKCGAVQYHTRPHKLFTEMLIPQARFTLRTLLWRRGLYRPKYTSLQTAETKRAEK